MRSLQDIVTLPQVRRLAGRLTVHSMYIQFSTRGRKLNLLDILDFETVSFTYFRSRLLACLSTEYRRNLRYNIVIPRFANVLL